MRDPTLADPPPAPDVDFDRKSHVEESDRIVRMARLARYLLRNIWFDGARLSPERREREIDELLDSGAFSWREAQEALDQIAREDRQ
jgi:hypothetical protein